MEALILTTLIDTLRAASKPKVEERLKPKTTALANLRSVVDRFEASLREDAEVAIVNEALRALGHEPIVVTSTVDLALKDVRRVLAEVSPVLVDLPPKPIPVVRATPPAVLIVPPEPRPVVVAPEPPPVVVLRPPKPKKPPPEPTALDLERAASLIAEVNTFAQGDFSSEHQIRLKHLFQAWVADARMLLERIHEPHEMHRNLVDQVIRGVAQLKLDAKVEPFIKGLAFGSKENWYRLSKDSRERVAKFDRDLNESPASRTKGPKSSQNAKPEAEAPKQTYQWPDLPLLRACMKEDEYPLLIVGGSYRDEAKLESVYERYGVRCEWCPFGHDNSRAVDAISDRIVTGKIAGVMMLEGFMSHKAYRRLMKASDQNLTVPIAMAGKGGVTAFGVALQDIERQYAAATYKIGKIKKDGEEASE